MNPERGILHRAEHPVNCKESTLTIGSLQPELIDQEGRHEAIRCLLPPGSGRLQAARFERFATENRIGLDWLWACRDEQGVILSSVLCVPSPGRTAMVFSSPAVSRDQVPIRITLLQHVLEHLRQERLDLAQVLLSCDDELARITHVESGFQELATLLYMERTLNRGVQVPVKPEGVELIGYTPEMESDLAVVLEASYESTLDCPGLCGLRHTKDIIAGHRATGQHDPDYWSLLTVDGILSGALLMNPSSTGDNVELVYLGLAKAIRGRGLGRFLLDSIIAKIAGGSPKRLTLAVDTMNQPAIDLYERSGFRGTAHRLALIYPLSASPGESP